MILPKGTIRVLDNKPSHYYVKLEDEDFAWWMCQARLNIKDEYKMHVRMTDEMVYKENYFKIFVPVEEYLKPFRESNV